MHPEGTSPARAAALTLALDRDSTIAVDLEALHRNRLVLSRGAAAVPGATPQAVSTAAGAPATTPGDPVGAVFILRQESFTDGAVVVLAAETPLDGSRPQRLLVALSSTAPDARCAAVDLEPLLAGPARGEVVVETRDATSVRDAVRAQLAVPASSWDELLA